MTAPRLTQVPTAWIPDSRYLVELANAAYKERNGRDVFLTDGEYRAKPIALSLFAWGLYGTRAKALEAKFGQIDWKTIHDAAIAAGGWPELGGDPAWGFFKLVVPNPRKNVGGLAAMVAAAGEYYNKPNITVEDVTNPEFQKWLKELMGSVTAISGASAYTAEDFALLGYSVGDGGQMLESDLLANMARHCQSLARSAGRALSQVRDVVRFPVQRVDGIGNERGGKECGAGISRSTC